MKEYWTDEEIEKIIAIAQQMLDGKINLIEGSRKLSKYCKDVYSKSCKVFLPFIAIDDDSDQCPLGEAQKNCSKVYLDKINDEISQYLKSIEAETRVACEEIILQFKMGTETPPHKA